MHLYNKKDRIAKDRPQGINIPGGNRRLIKVVSGDTLTFTSNVVCPATREPVKAADLNYSTVIYVAVAENRFNPVLWSGSTLDGWIKLDEYRPGLVHITVPRTVMGVLRRGSYSFSVVVDDGLVRETQLTGNFQIEYEPTGSINDIPYRRDSSHGNPISLTPEVDIAAQENRRMTHDQLIKAVDTISRTLLGTNMLSSILYGSCEHDPSDDEVDQAVHRLSQTILWDDELRSKIPSFTCETYDPSDDAFVERVCLLLKTAGIGWEPMPCRPAVPT